MKNLIFNYLLKNFLKTFFLCVLITYSFGMILNLFEEVEFFKNNDVSFLTPLMLTSIFVPSMVLKFLPFVIFISSMWFMIKIRNNKDLLTLKVYGYSNIKIFFILAFTSFILGWFVLVVANPITSSMIKYYEKTKSQYARDIDHLVTFNNNGLWIKESLKEGDRVITASKTEKFKLIDVTIFHFDNKYNLYEKIFAKEVDIDTNDWNLKNVIIYELENGIFKKSIEDTFSIESIYNYEKIMTYLIIRHNVFYRASNRFKLLNNGYNEGFKPKFAYYANFTILFIFNDRYCINFNYEHIEKIDNLKFIVLGLVISVLVYYFKDLSIALGQTDRIPLALSIWAPILALSLFTFIEFYK